MIPDRVIISATIIVLLAICAGQSCTLTTPPPSAGPPILRIEVEATPVPAALLTPVQSAFLLSVTPAYLRPTATPTLAPSAPLSPSPVLTGSLETPALPASPVTPPLPAAPPPELLPPPPVRGGENIYNGPLTSTLSLIDPMPGYMLPAGLDQLEFKWLYTGPAPRPCEMGAGYGFELRVWPHPANPYLPQFARDQLSPLGVVDAKQAQPAIAASCDPKTGSRRYLLTGLAGAPGIAQAGGQGQFFWDVAYVQLEPYYLVLGVAPPRDFFIPALGPTPTPGLTPTPTLAFPLTPQARPNGRLVLLKPDHSAVFPISVGPVQFEWRWEGTQSGICQVGPGYGFEFRVWSRQPGFTPLGVRDAVANQDQVHCDPATGVYSTIVPDLKLTPGVTATYQGELRWDGQFWWDVALVSLQPYLPPETASEPRPFDLSLGGYAGPLEAVRCSELGTWPEAQAFFLATGGPTLDPNNLDSDGNGRACEELIQ